MPLPKSFVAKSIPVVGRSMPILPANKVPHVVLMQVWCLENSCEFAFSECRYYFPRLIS
jgi:hypothetical protein